MTDRTPLKFEFDSTAPSSLAEFTSSDTVSVLNGGTGVSSLSLFGGSVSSLSAVNLSAASVSSPSFNGMPYPPPFSYIQMTADDTLTAAAKKVAADNTPTVINSDSSQLSWIDTTKQFNVSADGTYECFANITFEGGSTLVTVTVNKNGSAVLTVVPRVYSAVDPVERTVRAIFTAESGDNVDVTYDSNSGVTVKAITGTTVSVKRLK